MVFGEPGNELGYGRGFPATGHLRVEVFTESALITVTKTPELKKLGKWKLVADALQKTLLRSIGHRTCPGRFVLPVLPKKISTIVFSIKKF